MDLAGKILTRVSLDELPGWLSQRGLVLVGEAEVRQAAFYVEAEGGDTQSVYESAPQVP